VESYRDFPIWIVLYNAVTFGGVFAMGVIIAAQLPIWMFITYLALLLVVAVCLPALVCSRCGYYGHRCAMGVGKVVALVFKKRSEDEFFRTKPQFLIVLLYLLALILPAIGAIWIFADQPSAWRLAQLAVVLGLLLAGLLPHTKLACAHCRQGECGACPAGRIVWKRPRAT
jgi:hypothetical protein